MATTVARLQAVLLADTKPFDAGMTKSESRMQSAGKTAGRVGLAIAGGLAFGLERSVKAALDAQVSQARLEQAFRTSGISAARYQKQVEILETSGRKLGFTDEQTKTSLGSLLIATKSMTGASKDLSVAQDVARFRHVGLEQATKMLTMAMTGSQRAAKQLGISVQPVTDAEDRLRKSHEDLTTAIGKADLAHAKFIDKQLTGQAVIDTVSQKLGGQASVYSKTAAGGMEQFRAQLDHLEVSMGTGLLPILAKVAAAISRGTEYFSKHATMAKVVAGALGVLATALIAARTVQLAMNLAVLANPYVAAGVAVVAFGVLIYKFRDRIMNVFDWIKNHWPLLAGILGGPIGLAVVEIIKHRDRLVQIFTNLPGQIASAFSAGAGLVKDAIVGLFHKVIGWVKGALGISSPSKVFYEIGRNSIMGYVHGVGSMAGVLKDAVIGIAKNAAGSVIGAIPGAKGTIVGEGTGSGIHASPDVAKQFAVTQLKNYGWGPSQMIGLSQLWNGESGWRWNAMNQSSGAYGIPQSLPASKMASAGSDWHENAFTQIKWGLDYIKSRYGSPNAAWSAWQSRSPHWYDKGGWLPEGLSLAMNNTGRPERVLGPNEGGTQVVNVNVDGNTIATVVFDRIRGKARIYNQQNGRPAFGT